MGCWKKLVAVLILSGAVNMSVAEGIDEEFSRLNEEVWSIAEYKFSHPSFDTDWKRGRVKIDDGLLLELRPQIGYENRFSGGSIRTHETKSFGRYEVVMQPAKGKGVITGFFTYTGPHYGTRHDEIDIEFLGKNTRQIHIATFVDGVLWNKFIDLGFDASDRPRRYAFEWTKDAISWFVEDELIYKRDFEDGPIPQIPGQLYTNLWAADPSIKIWSGEVEKGINASAKIEKISYLPL